VRSLPNHHNPARSVSRGFTLVEMLVVAPIVLLVIAGLVVAMVSMIGDSLAANGRANVAYNMQDALDRIEQDARIATNFMPTYGYFNSPQGRDGNSENFSYATYKDLIFTQQATKFSPYTAETQQLIYYANRPAGCNPTPIGNANLTLRVVYFVKDNNLWRRVLVNPWTLTSGSSTSVCETPWQRNTCPPGSTVGPTSSDTCNGIDELILKNVTSWNPTFHNGSDDASVAPASGNRVKVSITTSQKIAGETVTETRQLRAARRNDIPTPLQPPTPTVESLNPDMEDFNNARLISITWNADNASSYSYRISTDGGTTWGAWVPTDESSVSLSVPAAGTTRSIQVRAHNDQGTSGISPTTPFTSRTWASCTPTNDWENYSVAGGSVTYADAQFTYSSTSKIVKLRGLVRYGDATPGTIICVLPEKFRPATRQLFSVATSGTTGGRVDVLPTGEVVAFSVNPAWVSLEQITFMASDAGYAWTSDLSGASSWTHFNSSDVSNVKVSGDGASRKHIRGVAKGGTVTSGANAFGLPGGYGVSLLDMYSAVSGSDIDTDYQYSAFEIASTGYIRSRGVGGNGYWGLNAMWYPSTATGWTTMTPLATGWSAYNTATWQPPRYKKGTDNLVTLSGLIKKSTAAVNPETIFTLPAGFRPARDVICGQPSNPGTSYARVDISRAGPIVLREGGSNGFVSLAGCDFFAEAVLP